VLTFFIRKLTENRGGLNIRVTINCGVTKKFLQLANFELWNAKMLKIRLQTPRPILCRVGR